MIARLFLSPDFARNRSLAAAIVCATLSGCGFTLLMPVIGINLEMMTGSGALVGLNGAAAALSTIIATPFVPGLLSRLPGRPLIVLSLIFAAVCLPLFRIFPDVTAWFVLRFAMGVAITIVFVASETWINQIATPARRATILAMYATALACGFGLGGLLLSVLGSQGWAPWIAGTLLFSLGTIPVMALRGPEIEPPSRSDAGTLAMFRAAAIAPTAIGAGLLFGATETIFFSLMPVYGVRIGLAEAAIGIIMACGAVGGIMMQVPVGRLADSIGKRPVVAAVSLVCLAGPAFVWMAGNTALALYAVMFVYVGLATTLYTLGLAMIGDRFTGGAIAAANAAFVMAYGVGSFAGPPVAGMAMDIVDPQGVLIVLSGFALVFIGVLTARIVQSRNG
ncbi:MULTISPECIES: MFS transporter [Hyphobacterium]|uniref:MFS transporter n=1 Tax=Hyphobacterium vulgare TaxID=1736751 RepID=A0ABV6ZTV6_9PROT